ncbi:MAG: trypsin-like peptidase domain-containing protein [Leptolyngbya sp. SIO1D8]|nr:trypsin-like peptidase domain-containing protein [Leptolyngbya sp. SIO1D8]
MNHITLEQLTEACTVRIRTSGKKHGHGTGFFIAPGYIITCAHVVRQAAEQEIFVLARKNEKETPAKLVYSFLPEVDLAILQVNAKFTSSCVYIGNEINSRDHCFTFGYTDLENGNPDGDPVTLECEGLAGKQRTVIKLKGGQVRPGLSGAPLLNQRTGKVCGVIRTTRNERFDLGGEAISLDIVFLEFPVLKESHDSFHQIHDDWVHYFQESIEPFPSDWSSLDKQDNNKWYSYIRVICFLVSVLFKWIVLGTRAPRAFPIETVRLLIKHTFSGDLGQEINKQRKELTRNLTKVDFKAGGQARIINQLESKASVLSELITILVPESHNIASSSRLLWAVELIYEQQDLLNELKELEGNSYPELESWKRKFGFLKVKSDNRYREVDRIINKLLLNYPRPGLIFLNCFYLTLEDLIGLIVERPILGIFVIDQFLRFLQIPILSMQKIDLSKEEDDEGDYAVLVKSVLEELENDIQSHPHLKVLVRTKILLENVAGKPITGGPFRAWGKSKSKNKYHFSRKCKFYPERVRPHEMNKIRCYDSHKEARKHHEPCQLCASAEKIKSSEFIGDEPS